MVLWNEVVSIIVNSFILEYVNITCREGQRKIVMMITFVHASYTFKKRVLWWELRSINMHNTLPWICLGDFDEVIYH